MDIDAAMAGEGARQIERPLTPAMFQILLALAGGEMHGYAIMQEVAASSQGQTHLGPGTLYRTIKSLLAGGLIAPSEERVDPSLDDERRRYYRMTELGRLRAQEEAHRLEGLVELARGKQILGERA